MVWRLLPLQAWPCDQRAYASGYPAASEVPFPVWARVRSGVRAPERAAALRLVICSRLVQIRPRNFRPGLAAGCCLRPPSAFRGRSLSLAEGRPLPPFASLAGPPRSSDGRDIKAASEARAGAGSNRNSRLRLLTEPSRPDERSAGRAAASERTVVDMAGRGK
jgi:hypothetical protein